MALAAVGRGSAPAGIVGRGAGGAGADVYWSLSWSCLFVPRCGLSGDTTIDHVTPKMVIVLQMVLGIA